MPAGEFVPPDFDVPMGLAGEEFRLTPLGREHNDADYAAWTSSIEHIRATPGFAGRKWPAAMAKADNLRDLENHAADFRDRRGFTYTVLDHAGVVIGCVYIYPSGRTGAEVRSWVRGDHSHLDRPLYDAVSTWLQTAWPFAAVEYARRGA